MTVIRLPQAGKELRLLQFTDPHLFADRGGEMRGVNTYESLARVLATARARHWPADAVLVTGDIAQDESREGYRVFREAMAGLERPVLCLPGNHDNPAFMQEELADETFVLDTIAFDSWDVIPLSTYIPGTASGELSDTELERLEAHLETRPDRHCLICLHHQPVPVGSRWLDGVGLRNGPSLLRVLDRHDNARGVVWGHVHQAFEDLHNGVQLMGTPSTCRQFLRASETFALDDAPPGYRSLVLGSDGQIATAVHYVD